MKLEDYPHPAIELLKWVYSMRPTEASPGWPLGMPNLYPEQDGGRYRGKPSPPDELIGWIEYCRDHKLIQRNDLNEWELTGPGEWVVTSTIHKQRPSELEQLHAQLDESDKAIHKIALSTASVDSKAKDIIRLDRKYLGYRSPEWAKLLGVSEAAIRKADFWKAIQEAKKKDTH